MTTALLIIDVQQALCTGRWACFEADRVIGRINTLIAAARAAGAPVVVVQHESVDGPLDHGSSGWQLAPALQVQPGDVRVRKRATDAFHETELHALLQARGVTRLVVCGFQSEFCVDSTVRRALGLGYEVTLVANGHATLDNGVLSAAQIAAHHTLTLAHVDSYATRVTPLRASEVRFAS